MRKLWAAVSAAQLPATGKAMKRYINEPAEEPPMPDYPEPSPDDIEPSPEDNSPREKAMLRCDFTAAEWAATEAALKRAIRNGREVLHRFRREGDPFFTNLAKDGLKSRIAALRAVRNRKIVW